MTLSVRVIVMIVLGKREMHDQAIDSILRGEGVKGIHSVRTEAVGKNWMGSNWVSCSSQEVIPSSSWLRSYWAEKAGRRGRRRGLWEKTFLMSSLQILFLRWLMTMLTKNFAIA